MDDENIITPGPEFYKGTITKSEILEISRGRDEYLKRIYPVRREDGTADFYFRLSPRVERELVHFYKRMDRLQRRRDRVRLRYPKRKRGM